MYTQCIWNFEPERFGGFAVDKKFYFRAVLNRQILRPLAFEDPCNVSAGRSVRVEKIGPIAHQAASLNKLAGCKDRRHRIANDQCCKLLLLADKKRIAGNHEPARPQFNNACED